MSVFSNNFILDVINTEVSLEQWVFSWVHKGLGPMNEHALGYIITFYTVSEQEQISFKKTTWSYRLVRENCDST